MSWARWVVDHHQLVPPAELWLPVHFWLLSVPYALGLESQIWPRLMSAVAGAASVPFFYLVVRGAFGAAAGVITAVLLALNPLHIRFSVLTVSEPFFLLFLTIGLWGFLCYMERGSRRHLLIGVVGFNLACGHRLEGWLILATLPLVGVFSSVVTGQPASTAGFRRALVFTILGSGFAVAWSLFSWLRFGDPIHAATLNQQLLASGYDPGFKSTSPLYTVLFWPGVLLAALGPLIFVLAMGATARNLLRGPLRLFALLFVGFLSFYYLQTFRSGMVTDARYALLLLWLLAFNLGAVANERHALTSGRVWTTSAIVWLAVVYAGARLPLGIVSQKLGSITPAARFAPEVRELDRWLRAQADVGSLVLGPGLRAYGPWLSSVDDWYPRRDLSVLTSVSQLAEHVAATESGSTVVARGALDGEVGRLSGKGFTEVASAGPYVIYHWGPRAPATAH